MSASEVVNERGGGGSARESLRFQLRVVEFGRLAIFRSASGSGSSPCEGALAARNVATSIISRPKNTCANRNRRPTRRQLRNSRFYLLREGIGRDIEILGLEPNQQVAYTATDEKRHEPRVAQFVQNTQGIGRDMRPRDRVIGARNDAGDRCGRHRGRVGGVQ